MSLVIGASGLWGHTKEGLDTGVIWKDHDGMKRVWILSTDTGILDSVIERVSLPYKQIADIQVILHISSSALPLPFPLRLHLALRSRNKAGSCRVSEV